MLEGMFVETIMTQSENRAYPQYPTITSGLMEGTQAIYRYGLRESSYPTLSIVDSISDGTGNYIAPGHYELALSDDRQLLLLLESKELIAVMPVFKLEVSMSKKAQVMDKKSLKKQKKEEKEIIKTNKKRAKVGMPPIDRDEEIYQEANIEYIKDGNYFLIKYERGDVKAWSAIKAD